MGVFVLVTYPHPVQEYAEGHGRNMHEDPQIPNLGISGRGLRLKSGMALVIEPMINLSTYKLDTEILTQL